MAREARPVSGAVPRAAPEYGSGMSDPVTLAVDAGVARLTLARPETGNAIDPPLAASLRAHAEALGDRDDVRAVLLTGEGKRFCVGGDLGYFAGAEDVGAALHALATELHQAILALQALDAPLVVAVQGAAAGAGLSLVAGADLAVAGQGTKLAMAYTAAGLSPDGGATWFLPRIIGTRRTAELALTNRPLSAAEALEIGLLTRVVPDDEVGAAGEELATRIAAGPTAALGTVKRLLARSSANDLATHLAAEADGIAAAAAGPDGREGVAAFLEKRRPAFTGRRD